ncbi:MAG: hypothetical protein IJ229_06235 [Clostridia bacterium]|nr:hypothetical protein [Clostridia bacterium]
MDLTTAEKREVIEQITALAKNDMLEKKDWDVLFRICLGALCRKLGKREMRKEN